MNPLDDSAARAAACSEFVRPLVLEAGAGTGKTRTLVARIGSWLLGAGWEQARRELADERAARGALAADSVEIAARASDGVVAITFTEAAAAEMARRVGRLLAQTAGGGAIDDLERLPGELTPQLAAERAHHLLAAAARVRISTIHGFCHRLLAEHPIEAGLHPAFRVDPEGDLLKEIATRVVLGRLRGGDGRLIDLLAAGVDPPDLLEAVSALAARGIEASELDGTFYAHDALAALLGEAGAAIDSLLELTAPLESSARVKSIGAGLAALRALRAALSGVAPEPAGLELLRAPLEAAAGDARKILEGWAKGRFGKTEQDEIGDVLDQVERHAAALARHLGDLSQLDPAAFESARAVLRNLLDELRGRLRAEGVLSFDDLLARATALLAERAGVRRRVRRGIRQLLVDEFQDTDRRQCELLRQLALRDPEEPRPGLFVVGDPKQSIYGWRSADLGAYMSFVDELRGAGARLGRLAVNFRSAPPILDEVERALAPVLREEPGIQAGFEPLLPSPRRAGDPGFGAAGRSAVEYWWSADRERMAAGESTGSPRAATLEAAAIASDIRSIVDAGTASFRDFALLLRARGDLDVYLDALRRSGIPYVVEKDRSFYRRREVVDAAAAVRAILDPGDLLALVAYLRSPFVGVPDAAWIPLWRAGFPAAMIALEEPGGLERALDAVRLAATSMPDGIPGVSRIRGWDLSLVAAVRDVAGLRVAARSAPVGLWLEQLRTQLLFEPITAARFLGRFGLANLDRLFADLELRLSAAVDTSHALAALRSAVAEETAAEEARPPDALDDAVAVLTVHTAKGLEFPHVYLAQSHRRGRGRSDTSLPTVDAEHHRGRLELVLFGIPTPGWRHVRAHRERVAAAEAARLLYVAMTRAQDRLVLCGNWPAGGSPAAGRAGVAPSFAELLSARIESGPLPDLEQAERRENDGTRWRLLESPPEEIDSPPPPPADIASAEGALHAAAELATRRDLARRRSARPLVAAASALAPNEESHAGGEAASAFAERPRRHSARALGRALHRALELAPMAERDPDSWREAVTASYLVAHPAAATSELRELDASLQRLLSSALWQRLRELAPRVVARELPIAVAGAAADASGPVAGVVGTLDLLYRDGDGGRLVVADFKSDALQSEEEVPARLERYRPQLEAYGRAVRDALGSSVAPRLELWLLALDLVVPLPAEQADRGHSR